MKRLYIVRHAKSSWAEPGLADFDRPLNKRGKHDAPAMGKRLAEAGVDPDLMISSPAKRAMSTAKKIADEIGYPRKQIQPEDEIYGAGPSTIVEVVRRVDDAHDSVMIFGHNPTFTDVANQLGGTSIDNLPTCAIVCIDFQTESWKDISEASATHVSYDYPKLH